MQHLKNYYEYLLAFDPADDHSLDRCHSLFLIGGLMSKKPRHVLELGIGTGAVTVAMVYALRYNGVGDLTCVDNLSWWGGAEPDGIDAIRASGVNLLTPASIIDFLQSCPAGVYDFVVADGRLVGNREMELLYEAVADNAFLFVRNTQGDGSGAVEAWLRQMGIRGDHFSDSTREDEHCEKGFLFTVLTKSADQKKAPKRPRANTPAVAAIREGKDQPAIHPKPELHKEPLYLGLVTGENYGWGVCSQYLIKELSRKIDCHVLNVDDGSDCNPNLDGKLLQAITGIDFFPMFEKARGRRNIGYTFFENELNLKSIENARQYDLILGGSSWCRDRMLEKGIGNCDVLLQGIDPTIFYPIENTEQRDQFVIFSGGKFELRKGQDLVLKAVKILQDKYEDIVLANCWYNIWPESMRWMAHSRHIDFKYKELPWLELMHSVYQANGLDSSRIKTFELVPNEMQRSLYTQTDLGVFPNRCEGGTNLVMMEYMACGKPVVAANTTGQADIVTDQNALLLNNASPYNIAGPDNELIARWQEPSLDELIAQIEYAYLHRYEINALGQRAGEDMKAFTWRESAKQLLKLLRL